MKINRVVIDGNVFENISDFEFEAKNYCKEPTRNSDIDGLKPTSEVVKKIILTDIRDYLVAILDEWHKRIDEPNFYEHNIGVYNHLRKELDDLTEYAEKLGVEL